jgi:hypothetical protein
LKASAKFAGNASRNPDRQTVVRRLLFKEFPAVLQQEAKKTKNECILASSFTLFAPLVVSKRQSHGGH